MTVRLMMKDDKPAVVRILRDIPEFTANEVKVAEELINLYLQYGTGSGYHLLVDESDFEINGYICYGPIPLTESTWDIYWIAVAPDKQGRGAGRMLMEAAESDIYRVGGKLVLIETSSKPDYEKTRNFYRSLEYEQIACVPDFYASGDDKLVLQKIL